MTEAQLRRILPEYPGVSEAPSYGTPGWRVRKKLLARIHQSEPAVVLHVGSIDAQETLIAAEPEMFYVTDHYEGHPWVLARLSKLRAPRLREIAEAAWRRAASRKQIAELDEGTGASRSAPRSGRSRAPGRARG